MAIFKARAPLAGALESVTLADLDRFEVGNHCLRSPNWGSRRRDKTLGLTVEADSQSALRCLRYNVIGHRWHVQIGRACLYALSDFDLFAITLGLAEMANKCVGCAIKSQGGAR